MFFCITVSNPVLPHGYEFDNVTKTLWFNNTMLNQSFYTEAEWLKITGGYNFDEFLYKKIYYIAVTDLRKNPDYHIYYNNWTRLFLIGIIPTVFLIYFNYKVNKFLSHFLPIL